jgi:hypothetical protein
VSRADDAHTLAAAYREEVALYREALALASAHANPGTTGDDDWPLRLNEILRGVQAVETRIAAAKKRWQAEPKGPDAGAAAVDAAVAEVAEAIAALQGAIGAVIGRVEKRREALMPEMAAFVRTDRVRQAYRRTEHLNEPRNRRG